MTKEQKAAIKMARRNKVKRRAYETNQRFRDWKRAKKGK